MRVTEVQGIISLFTTPLLGINATINAFGITQLGPKTLAKTHSNSDINRLVRKIVGRLIPLATLIQITSLTLVSLHEAQLIVFKRKQIDFIGSCYINTTPLIVIPVILRKILNIQEMGLQTRIQTSSPITKKIKILFDIMLISLAINSIYIYIRQFRDTCHSDWIKNLFSKKPRYRIYDEY